MRISLPTSRHDSRDRCLYHTVCQGVGQLHQQVQDLHINVVELTAAKLPVHTFMKDSLSTLHIHLRMLSTDLRLSDGEFGHQT